MNDQHNSQAVATYLDSVCLHHSRLLDGRGNLVCEVCGKVEPADELQVAADLYEDAADVAAQAFRDERAAFNRWYWFIEKDLTETLRGNEAYATFRAARRSRHSAKDQAVLLLERVRRIDGYYEGPEDRRARRKGWDRLYWTSAFENSLETSGF